MDSIHWILQTRWATRSAIENQEESLKTDAEKLRATENQPETLAQKHHQTKAAKLFIEQFSDLVKHFF